MIEMGKSYRTRDGREVRIYATDGGTVFPVQGAIRSDEGDEWSLNIWRPDGKFFQNGESVKDLVEADPHGAGMSGVASDVMDKPYLSLAEYGRSALRALAKQDQEKTA